MSTPAEHWERQKREIDSYNVFLSAFHGQDHEETLMNAGYVSPIRFPEVPIRGQQKNADPDVISSNGENLLLVEVKSGGNIDSRSLRQAERMASVDIEDAQEFMRNTDMYPDFEPRDISKVDSVFVYSLKKYEDSIVNQSRKLSELEDKVEILTQERGGKLIIQRGQIQEQKLSKLLNQGIQLPGAVPRAVHLNENVERESLAASICYDYVLPSLKNGDVTISASDVGNIYPSRAVPDDKIRDVLHFLDLVGACDGSNDGQFTFTNQHRKKIHHIEEELYQNRVKDYLEGYSKQRSLGEFAE